VYCIWCTVQLNSTLCIVYRVQLNSILCVMYRVHFTAEQYTTYDVKYSWTALLSCYFAVSNILARKKQYIFSKILLWVLTPTCSPIQWLSHKSFLWGRWPGCEAEHSLLSSGEVKNEWSCTSSTLIWLRGENRDTLLSLCLFQWRWDELCSTGSTVVDRDATTVWSIVPQIIELLQVFMSRNFCRIFSDYAAKSPLT
jgi:hypothetical protein